jgi:superfamily II RNA helicase
MLPAIFFSFSRRGSGQAVEQVRDIPLLSAAEAIELDRRIEEFLAWNPGAARSGQVEPLKQGIAAHHAGILPAWKALVEELFQLGLVKVVFATETLAAGINMPARSTVISSISKRTDRGHRLLKASEFLQMAGRAGRRGMDEQGYVVTVQTRFEGAKDAADLAIKEAEPLVSQFTPTYGMVLNLLQTHSIDEVKELLERSFAQYIAALKLDPEKQAIASLTTELAKLDMELAPIEPEHITHYEKLHQRLKEEQRLLRVLEKQANEVRAETTALLMQSVDIGQVLLLKDPTGKETSNILRAVLFLVSPESLKRPEQYLCLTTQNDWILVDASRILEVTAETVPLPIIDAVEPPCGLNIHANVLSSGDENSAPLAEAIPMVECEPDPAPEVIAQQQRLHGVEVQLEHHPLHQWGNPGKLVKRYHQRLELQQKLRERQATYKEHQTHHWREFLNLVKVLREFDALHDYQPTDLGKAAASIRGDNELWLGLVLTSGYLDLLNPEDLAAAVYTLISEPPRSDSWTDYLPSETLLMMMAKLNPLRKQLIKCQFRYKVALPVWLEDETLDFAGIISQWAYGVTWEDLCEHTSFDEGDLVRMLRRTMDFLSQIPHVPGISPTLKNNAQDALQLMMRFPVEETIM